MDGCDLEPGRRLFDRDRRLHQLLRDAHGRENHAIGYQKYRGLTRRSGRRYVWTGRVHLDLAALGAPATWRKPRRVFVNSMSDLFHPAVPATFVGKVWDTMAEKRQHTYQILTKRPERATAIVADFPVLPNVWLGTSVKSEEVLHRMDQLRGAHVAIRFPPSSPCSVPLRLQISSAFIGRSLAARADRARANGSSMGGRNRGALPPARCRVFFKQWGGTNKKTTGRLVRGRTLTRCPPSTAVPSDDRCVRSSATASELDRSAKPA